MFVAHSAGFNTCSANYYLEEVNQVVDCTANVQVWFWFKVLPLSLHSERSGHSVSYGYRTAHPLRVSPFTYFIT